MTSRSPRHAASLLPSIVGLALLVLGGGLFWHGLGDSPSASLHTASATPTVHERPKHRGVPIEQVRLGQRVPGTNPEVSDIERSMPDPDPATWRALDLVMQKADGGQLEIGLLRPLFWIEEHGAAVGETIHLDLAELGAEGPAKVLAIRPCPPIKPGRGRVVTGRFAHSAGNVVELSVEGLDEPIGVTANHPFWSEDQQAFIPAGDLTPGETLLGLDGRPLRVLSLAPRGSPQPVYNLEVDTEHVYLVTKLGVLVHNNGCRLTAVARELRGLALKGWKKGKGAIHFVKHGRSMGFNNVREYTQAAKALQVKAENVVEGKVGNLIFKFDKEANHILIVNARERTIKTFHLAADGINSFKQAMRNHLEVLKAQGAWQ